MRLSELLPGTWELLSRIDTDATGAPRPDPAPAATNNSCAVGGYDAYFGTYTINDEDGTVTQVLCGSLSNENVGMTLTRAMTVVDDTLVIRLQTTSGGEAVTRELRWKRVSH